MTTTTTVTLADLTERLKVTPWPHTFDGIPVWEIGDDGEWLMTIGHVDKAAFAKACDAYYRATSNESLTDVYNGDISLAHVTDEAVHRKASVSYLEEFPNGDFAVLFDEGDVDVTTWTAY